MNNNRLTRESNSKPVVNETSNNSSENGNYINLMIDSKQNIIILPENHHQNYEMMDSGII